MCYTENMTKYQERLLQKISQQLAKLTSLKQSFLSGIVYGLGTALGASVVLAFALWLLARFVATLENIPAVGDWVQKAPVEEILGK